MLARVGIVDALSDDPENLDLEKISSLRDELIAMRSATTFSAEFAAAIAGVTNDNRFSTLNNYRYGAWLNLRWQPNGKLPVSLVGVARYTRAPGASEVSKSDSAFLDFGLGVSYANNRFDLQLEYVKRSDLDHDKTYERTTLVSNYRVLENLFIVGTLGKNFDNVHDVLVLFGVKFGISTEKIKAAPGAQ